MAKQQRQLWCVPSGQGKSRISATAAAIAYMIGIVEKVHMVFENDHLMQRDKKDFNIYW
jgi:preprotein translocase subunit SecA